MGPGQPQAGAGGSWSGVERTHLRKSLNFLFPHTILVWCNHPFPRNGKKQPKAPVLMAFDTRTVQKPSVYEQLMEVVVGADEGGALGT